MVKKYVVMAIAFALIITAIVLPFTPNAHKGVKISSQFQDLQSDYAGEGDGTSISVDGLQDLRTVLAAFSEDSGETLNDTVECESLTIFSCSNLSYSATVGGSKVSGKAQQEGLSFWSKDGAVFQTTVGKQTVSTYGYSSDSDYDIDLYTQGNKCYMRMRKFDITINGKKVSMTSEAHDKWINYKEILSYIGVTAETYNAFFSQQILLTVDFLRGKDANLNAKGEYVASDAEVKEFFMAQYDLNESLTDLTSLGNVKLSDGSVVFDFSKPTEPMITSYSDCAVSGSSMGYRFTMDISSAGKTIFANINNTEIYGEFDFSDAISFYDAFDY